MSYMSGGVTRWNLFKHIFGFHTWYLFVQDNGSQKTWDNQTVICAICDKFASTIRGKVVPYFKATRRPE